MPLPLKFLHAAGCLFAQECGAVLTRSEKDEIAWAGLRAGDAPALAEELLRNLAGGRTADANYRGRAWRALGRRTGAVDLHTVRCALREELARDMGVAWQVMLALQDLGETVFSPARPAPALWEQEDNRQDAMRYLAAALPDDAA